MSIKSVAARSEIMEQLYAIGHSIILEKDDGDARYISFSDASPNSQVAKALRSLADWVEEDQ